MMPPGSADPTAAEPTTAMPAVSPESTATAAPLTAPRVEFCGEWTDVDPQTGLGIGREADLSIDDNPFLHRVFLRVHAEHGLWWLSNVGSVLSATISDASGAVQAWLGPGARLPIVFPTLHVMFTAGSTTYDFTVHTEQDYFATAPTLDIEPGTTTRLPMTFTSTQRLLMIALAEDVLRQSVPGRGAIPSSADAAARLGWPITTFNRKLDNVCDKLDRIGVQGLRGGPGKLATQRRARLVEYAIVTRLVCADDLALLDAHG